MIRPSQVTDVDCDLFTFRRGDYNIFNMIYVESRITERMHDGGSVGVEVAERIANCEGVDPTDLEPPLNESVDLEALDTLLQSTRPDATVRFNYRQYEVEVSNTGQTRVTLTRETDAGGQSRKPQSSD